MKVVILAGGYGTRIGEETGAIPKPMVEIGGKPILWHVMKIYSSYGFNDFIICLGYKSYVVKEYFSHYFMHMSDVTFDLKNNRMEIHTSASEPWKVTMIDTGLETFTGGRLKRIEKYVGNETFMMTYGDGVGDIDMNALLRSHKNSGKLATLSAIQPAGRFGVFDIRGDNKVSSFLEKPKRDGAWINVGFFVLEPGIFRYIKKGDKTTWEKEPLENLAKDGRLTAYKHTGFWKCMDTLKDKLELEQMWQTGKAPWKIWK
ncbi:MAG: glucose-1-phosphate cytidylyltransferase [Candidatus Omnitrophica bacterium]|nr:glucose-1-phosphate cytidylyltransferase [Candidatus Omnitrophota bacterium]